MINARFASPLDQDILKLPGEGKSIITVEDHNLACGFGSAFLESAFRGNLGFKKESVRVLAAPGGLIGHDSRKNQFIQAGINADKIVETARELVGLK